MTYGAERGRSQEQAGFTPARNAHAPSLDEGRERSERGRNLSIRVGAGMNPRAALVLLVLAVVACGRKTEVKAPQLVAPRVVTEVSLTTRADGIEIGWGRPTEYVDGTTMDDLGGFVVERSRNNEAFRELARVAVTDRGRFQKAKRFQYVDQTVTEGTTYHYRVVAFTTDGYYSSPSGAATLIWERPQPSPSPGAPTHAHPPKDAASGHGDLDSGLPAGSGASQH